MLSMITSSTAQPSPTDVENLVIERKNIINICKLVVKDLIDSFLVNQRRCVGKESSHLVNFFDVFENVLNHGLKGKRAGVWVSMGFNKKDFASLLDSIASKCEDLSNTLKSVKDMAEIKTSVGKIRAWYRLALMQKKLSEHFTLLIEQKEALKELYDDEALLTSDEASIIAGLLIGLNAIDFSIDLKSYINEFDSPIKPINYSMYLRERLPDSDQKDETMDTSIESSINSLFDQKNYLEEINKRLELQIEQLQVKIQTIERSNGQLVKDIEEFKNENVDLKSQLEETKQEMVKMEADFKVKTESIVNDVNVERETFQQSKTGLDQMYIELQKKMLEESKNRILIESELKTKESLRNELEIAIKLLTNDLKGKQETIAKLNQQLEEHERINLDYVEKYRKLEDNHLKQCKEFNENKQKLTQLSKENEEMTSKIEKLEIDNKSNAEKCQQLTETHQADEKKIAALEAELKIERDWRVQLQNDLSVKNELLKTANNQIELLNQTKKEYEELKEEHGQALQKLDEAERTLEEMGSKLGVSHLKMQDFKEVTKQINEFQWEADEQVTTCKLCSKDFNLARRKHHCRRCGRIFCNECSDQRMLLPSSSKPVRVCNTCATILLQQSIATD